MSSPLSQIPVWRYCGRIAKINMGVIDTFIKDGVDAAMNRYNATNLGKKEEGEETDD